MLVNDVSLRNLIPAELAKGFGFFQSKPASAFSPVAVTPDELGEAWSDGKVHLPLQVALNGEPFGAPECGRGHDLLLPAADRACREDARLWRRARSSAPAPCPTRIAPRGSACIAERRSLETIEHGAPRTPFLKFGDRVRIEMLDLDGHSIFGAIDQQVQRHGG